MMDVIIISLNILRSFCGISLMIVAARDYYKYQKQPSIFMAMVIILCMQ